MNISRLSRICFSSCLLLALLFIFDSAVVHSQQSRVKKESAKTALIITDYRWRSGGRGREGILESVTIENVGSKDYENISIEIDFISSTDVPQGSLRTTINDNLVSGATKTFTNVSIGMMNTDLEKSVIRITGAKVVERGIDSPKDVIIVKDYEWLETNYTTEGILKFITLDNLSNNNYKKIQISIESQGGGDSRKVPFRTTIHEYLPAKSEKTYKDINVGFKYKGARNTIITVTDAQRISNKEYRSILAKEGIRIDKDTPGIDGYGELEQPDFEDSNLSLAERYRKNVLKIEPESERQTETAEIADGLPTEVVPEIEHQTEDYAYYRDPSNFPKRVDNAISDEQLLREQAKIFPEVFQEIVIVSAEAEPMDDIIEKPVDENYQIDSPRKQKVVYQYKEKEKKKNIFSRAIGWSKDLVGLGDDEEEYEEQELVETRVALNDSETQTGKHPYTSVDRADVDERNFDYEPIEDDEAYLLESDKDLEPLPRIDLEIRDFELKPGIVSTIGQLDKITIVNKSNITYTNIQLEVTFYNRGSTKQLGSNKFFIDEIIPKRTRRTFNNVEIGFLNTPPEELRIRIVDAVAIN